MSSTKKPSAEAVVPSKELMATLWRNMNLARCFEERVQWLFSKGLVHGTTHLGIGEEATGSGTIAALKPQDYVFGTHRGHGQAIAKGIDVNHMMAEILARSTGVCKGKGGSMHIADPDIHYFGADGILGASAVMCVGTALAIHKRKEQDRISVVFFGDGTSNEGATWEAMNLASIWQLPVLFVCVNNTYGMSTPIADVMRDTDISKRAYPFDMPSKSIDGNNVLEVYKTIAEARAYVSGGNGPMLVVENTYRISGHSKSDGNLYRTKEEIAAWKEKCPIKAFRKYLVENGIFTEVELDAAAQDASDTISAAEAYAKSCPEPSIDDLLSDVYA
ncbi:pyruvate dehydrogenase E1 component alpha subunit [Oscillibacter sp. PC13]|uniref:thiamine pyrophosphate-dependent dehydrogenase E1 component subunit alpha n=1 Tax=Oscillibacter sp. PC13 TaxID=1855299 RepID=UPI0008ED6A84|nr:thiamine pyrophosphate-dependent dehydrogenase E1 component subunit alpha [Oscillibacter sp. PC13]SFP65345.1 pyruvate dehydrogenase E1 component alpha subunit [Oscillibacter sp. PC13]